MQEASLDSEVKTQEIISEHKQDEAEPVQGRRIWGTGRTCNSEAHP